MQNFLGNRTVQLLAVMPVGTSQTYSECQLLLVLRTNKKVHQNLLKLQGLKQKQLSSSSCSLKYVSCLNAFL